MCVYIDFDNSHCVRVDASAIIIHTLLNSALLSAGEGGVMV